MPSRVRLAQVPGPIPVAVARAWYQDADGVYRAALEDGRGVWAWAAGTGDWRYGLLSGGDDVPCSYSALRLHLAKSDCLALASWVRPGTSPAFGPDRQREWQVHPVTGPVATPHPIFIASDQSIASPAAQPPSALERVEALLDQILSTMPPRCTQTQVAVDLIRRIKGSGDPGVMEAVFYAGAVALAGDWLDRGGTLPADAGAFVAAPLRPG